MVLFVRIQPCSASVIKRWFCLFVFFYLPGGPLHMVHMVHVAAADMETSRWPAS